MQEIAQNRPREQDFDAWQTLAEVKAGSARFLAQRRVYRRQPHARDTPQFFVKGCFSVSYVFLNTACKPFP